MPETTSAPPVKAASKTFSFVASTPDDARHNPATMQMKRGFFIALPPKNDVAEEMTFIVTRNTRCLYK